LPEVGTNYTLITVTLNSRPLKLLLTPFSTVIIISTGSPAQLVFGIFVSVVYIKLYGYFQPYAENEDDFLQEFAQYFLFTTLFIILLVNTGKLSEV
jgi:hypothetical protein